MDKDIECYNCHKKGHKKADCWAKGGGKEGQGPRTKPKKEKKEQKKELANTAGGDEDEVWMAMANSSGDEMTDTKFNNFTISKDNLFLFEDKDEDSSTLDLTMCLKQLLKISDPSKYIAYPYDNLDYFMDATNFTDSSDDKQGATTMKVLSESDNKVEIDPYWSKITVDKLQKLGNSMEILLEDDDSIPDLESMSEAEESVIFALIPENLMSTAGLEKGSHEESIILFTDKEITELEINKGEDGLTTFDAAMLINIDGFNEGTQTELYNSGALRHMSPYRDHFENYMPIAPKLITADKRYFQAIGKKDLQIKIPNGLGTTTILLKDVFHCPDMGLTLVSIGKITVPGYKVIFRGPTCRIYNCKDKIIQQINARNGLYHVDHEIVVNAAMSGQAQEVLTIEELHHRMGHIAPETIRYMISNGGFEGMNIDLTSMIQPCDSCEYANTTQKHIKKVHETPRAAKFSDEIHLDIWGPLPIQTAGHKEYYVSFTDDSTRWTHLQLLAMKDSIFKAWAKLHFEIQTFKTLRSDRGGEYLGKAFSQHLQSQGTIC